MEKWWKKYIESDMIERGLMIDKLPVFAELMLLGSDKHDIDNKTKKHIINTLIQSYFDDCISVMETMKDD